MAWNTEYNLTFPDYFGTQWDIDIQTEDFVGDITDLIGTGDPVKISYEPMEYFTHTPIKSSFCEINLIELVDDTYKKFFTTDKTAKIKIYKGSDLFWQGWSTAEGYHSLYNLCPKPVTLTFIDGLSFLKSKPLNVADTGAAAIDEVGIFSLNKYFKQALDEIGFGCNIYESFNLYDYRVNQALSPFTETHLDTWCFYRKDLNEKYESLYDVLSKVLTSWGARIYQKDGCWYMDHIRQLNDGSITYRRYNSALAYQESAVENRTYDITARSGSPLLVPVNHSLYKELERPYSKFILSSNYRLDKELIRYIDKPTVEGDVSYSIDEDKYLKINEVLGTNNTDGLIYNLGRVDFTGLVDPIMTVRLKGEFYGAFSVSLYIYNEANATNYYYWGLYDGDPTKDAWHTSNLYVLHAATTANWRHMRALDQTYEIYADEETFKGTMYLMICAPYNDFNGVPPLDPQLILELDYTGVTYNECERTEKTQELENTTAQTNKKDLTLNIYGEPKRERYITYGGVTTQETLNFVNPHLVYPGIFFYYDGDEYLPCYSFKYGGDEVKRMEMFLLEDIMMFYANLRLRILGTLMGQIDFGKVLDYDSKRYMIVSLGYSLKSSQNEVTAIQISEVGSYLLNEDGTYILTEDGNKIPI